MAKKKEGFLDSVVKSIGIGLAVEMSKDEHGKPDPYKVAGMAAGGINNFSSKDMAALVGLLDYEGAFGEDDTDDYFSDYDSSTDWRRDCEDGWEYGVRPEDYYSQDEYEEALNEAKYGWRETNLNAWAYGLNLEDYETEEEFEDAVYAAEEEWDQEYMCTDDIDLAEDATEELEDNSDDPMVTLTFDFSELLSIFNNSEEETAVQKFISENKETILAAKYLTSDGQFLYAKAVKDHFSLPIALPDETDYREYEFEDIIKKIARKDDWLSLEVWSWCLEQFLPYADYENYAKENMTNDVIDELYQFPDDYRKILALYMEEYPDFRSKIVESAPGVSMNIPEIIVAAIQEELFETAKALFHSSYAKVKDDWEEKIYFINGVISQCKNYSELESIEYFETEFFPVVKQCELPMVKDEIEEWEKQIQEYVKYMEENCEKYEYSRCNSWRCHVPDGSEYGMIPTYYSSEEEYMKDLEEYKYGWRECFSDDENYGLNVNDYETRDEFIKAQKVRRQEVWKEKQADQKKQREMQSDTIVDDKTIYTYCGVMLPHSKHPYSYRTDDPQIKVGDVVIVPVGNKGEEVSGTVVSVGQYTRAAVPYPVEETRFVIRKS